MFLSTYIPVNMHRDNCAVYSEEKIFPEKKLLAAHDFLESNESVSNVYMEDNSISFLDDSSIKWTIPEVYLAYEAYYQAKKSSFSYYVCKDESGIPQLFISRSFKGHRLIVNALSMRTLLLSNSRLVAKAASLIDKTISCLDSTNLFSTMEAVEAGSARFLPGLIAYRGTVDEYLAVSPVMTPSTISSSMFGSDEIEEIKSLFNGIEGDDFSYKRDEDGNFYRTDLETDNVIPVDVAKYLVEVYDKMKEKKSNYVELRNPNYVTELYFSTNHRYLVNARTFECVVIKNQHTKTLLTALAKLDTISSGQLYMVWSLAKTE